MTSPDPYARLAAVCELIEAGDESAQEAQELWVTALGDPDPAVGEAALFGCAAAPDAFFAPHLPRRDHRVTAQRGPRRRPGASRGGRGAHGGRLADARAAAGRARTTHLGTGGDAGLAAGRARRATRPQGRGGGPRVPRCAGEGGDGRARR